LSGRESASIFYKRDERDWRKEKVVLGGSQSTEVLRGVVSLGERPFGREEMVELSGSSCVRAEWDRVLGRSPGGKGSLGVAVYNGKDLRCKA